jgi:hypothetical protein
VGPRRSWVSDWNLVWGPNLFSSSWTHTQTSRLLRNSELWGFQSLLWKRRNGPTPHLWRGEKVSFSRFDLECYGWSCLFLHRNEIRWHYLSRWSTSTCLGQRRLCKLRRYPLEYSRLMGPEWRWLCHPMDLYWWIGNAKLRWCGWSTHLWACKLNNMMSNELKLKKIEEKNDLRWLY